jgi:SAM-dependent methyltransferase
VNQTDKTEAEVTTEYQEYLKKRHGAAWARRTAERNAAFLLPHLTPGMRLLDAGCGPGSITIGLAPRVGPDGEAIGIDINEERLEFARGLAKERGVTNVRFETADVYALPFEDASFDAAFMHAVLQHLPDPVAALREVRRVLRPGAVIGISDADLGTGIVWPPSPAIDASFELMVRLREHDGGTPYAGRMLRQMLHDAGFERVTAKAVAGTDGGPPEVNRYMASWQMSYFEEPAVIARITSLGLATEAELWEMAAAWREWGEAPGGYSTRLMCEAVGWVG